MKNNGFTLIEMLAVVLIIAMLVSVALPKYKRSVVRAEAMEALTNLRTLQDSALRAKAARPDRSTPKKLNDLDVDLFDATDAESATFTFGRYTYTLGDDYISATKIGRDAYSFYAYYPNLSGLGGEITCSAPEDLVWLCEGLCREGADGCVMKNGQYVIN